MKQKKEIDLEDHNSKSAQMDKLCDINDFDGIIKLCEDLDGHTHALPLIRLHIYFNIGTGYSHVASRRAPQFDSKFSGLALLNYRKGLAEAKTFARDSFGSIPPASTMQLYYDLRSRLLTNLANELNSQGRVLEALAYYEDPISYGNVHAVLSKASCIYRLAQDVYDDSHAFYLQRESSIFYREALDRINEFPIEQKMEIKNNPFYGNFIDWFSNQEKMYGSDFPELEGLKGGKCKTKQEGKYLQWCAENRLFINELNGISISEVVNHDVLTLPGFSYRMNSLLTSSEELGFHGHFDEMKTDYCYARYLAFMASSISLFNEHFFNSTFDHVDTLDYEINNLKTNHLKSCFRISYSIFDKISFFLHRFFRLDAIQNDHKVDFKKVWFNSNNKNLKAIFQNSNNRYFKALFFISHEIRQGSKNIIDDEDLSYWFDPDTQRLFKIRNAMEHRAFKLVDGTFHRISNSYSPSIEQYKIKISDTEQELHKLLSDQKNNLSINDSLYLRVKKLENILLSLKADLEEKEMMASYSVAVGIEEFETLTMKLLTLAKDALIYLSLAIHHEESKKPQDGVLIPNEIPIK
ncbi:hypothetical protein CBP51_03085 [Cellvibrio mixtus]|uniref:LA2681-like HEPN domain-containing protein n=1 Tax=Cellvibrio mixtus TaxID=39650 RepID=A0A266Q9K2_9GAMM|nr:LA2681 family HEPN domain-containing protein [Cellvibrio mixtus]OZY86029.1 hypothetical protein CBP51_03085 [Cellvibrio mixtus]